MSNDRDFIFDNFELEDEDNEILNFNENVSVEPVVETVEPTEENNKIFPSINLNELTDEQQDRLFTVLGEGLNKILRGLASFDDDDIPF